VKQTPWRLLLLLVVLLAVGTSLLLASVRGCQPQMVTGRNLIVNAAPCRTASHR